MAQMGHEVEPGAFFVTIFLPLSQRSVLATGAAVDVYIVSNARIFKAYVNSKVPFRAAHQQCLVLIRMCLDKHLFFEAIGA